MSKQNLHVTIIIHEEEEGGYSAQCVELPGAISQGETKEEVMQNIKEAVIGYLEAFPEDLDVVKQKKEVVELFV